MAQRKTAVRRDKSTGELEPPWAGYWRQLEMQAAAMTPDELKESQRLAALLVSEGLPAGWLYGVEVDVQGELWA
jgi:hypothetical protein